MVPAMCSLMKAFYHGFGSQREYKWHENILPASPYDVGSALMSEAEIKLLQLLKERSFRRGTFQLASGDTSDYYIDGRMTQVFSEGAYLIGEIFYEHTKDLNIDALGGL